MAAMYALFAVLATTEGIGYSLHTVRTQDPHLFVAVPDYDPLLWMPAVAFGAGAWGPLSWLNTIWWVTAAVLVGKGLALLARRLHPDRPPVARLGPAGLLRAARPAARHGPAAPSEELRARAPRRWAR